MNGSTDVLPFDRSVPFLVVFLIDKAEEWPTGLQSNLWCFGEDQTRHHLT
jgi:hypothetical protein